MARWNEVDHGLQDKRTPPNFQCIECGGNPKLTDGREIYPHRSDLHSKRFYKCDCGAYCGCHPETTTPLGYPCGEATRKARSAAHAVVDPIWRDKLTSRKTVYFELARRLHIPREECHIAWMTAEETKDAIRVGKEIREELEAKKT